MSKVDLNALVNGLSGKLGNAVLVKRGSSTYLASLPKKRTSAPTANEIAQRDRFRRAAAYAKAVINDPALKAAYEAFASRKESLNAFTAALSDFLKLPKIYTMQTAGYTGNVNDEIIVRVYEDFKIIAVQVSIILPNGVLLESGAATFDTIKLEWKYVTTVANPTLAGTTVEVKASDRPGNETIEEAIL